MSQIEGPFPSSFHAPSIWKALVAVPKTNPSGNDAAGGVTFVMALSPWSGDEHRGGLELAEMSRCTLDVETLACQ
ncbi:hypothetical protein GCM10022245_18820 [Streptomyces mayteni]